MTERYRALPERLSDSPIHAEVRWYDKDSTGHINPLPRQTVHLLRLQAVVIGTSYHVLEVFSAENVDTLQRELGIRQAKDKIIGRYKGLAMVDHLSKLTMEIDGAQQQTAELSEGNKTGTVQLANSDTFLIGIIGENQEDVDKEFDNVFFQDSNQS